MSWWGWFAECFGGYVEGFSGAVFDFFFYMFFLTEPLFMNHHPS